MISLSSCEAVKARFARKTLMCSMRAPAVRGGQEPVAKTNEFCVAGIRAPIPLTDQKGNLKLDEACISNPRLDDRKLDALQRETTSNLRSSNLGFEMPFGPLCW